MAILDQDKKTTELEDYRAPRRILTASEGEALLRRLSEPARKPTKSMMEAVRAHKRLLSQLRAR